jgi:hypothetical protein
VRQFVTIHVLRPLAKSLGIKGGKIMRFTERESRARALARDQTVADQQRATPCSTLAFSVFAVSCVLSS